MAINSGLLIHDVVFRSTTGITRERKRTFDEYTLHKVRVVPNVSRKYSTAGEIPADSAVLFVDATYSYCEPISTDEAEAEDENEENSEVDEDSEGEDVSSDDTLTTGSSGSTPLVPIVGDEIVFANRVWQVASVTMVYGTGAKVHHWEMLLV